MLSGKNGAVYCPKVGKSVTDSLETVGMAVYPETKAVSAVAVNLTYLMAL